MEIIKKFARAHFKSTAMLDYALEVEKVTTRKRANLILNVDGTCVLRKRYTRSTGTDANRLFPPSTSAAAATVRVSIGRLHRRRVCGPVAELRRVLSSMCSACVSDSVSVHVDAQEVW